MGHFPVRKRLVYQRVSPNKFTAQSYFVHGFMARPHGTSPSSSPLLLGSVCRPGRRHLQLGSKGRRARGPAATWPSFRGWVYIYIYYCILYIICIYIYYVCMIYIICIYHLDSSRNNMKYK
jgi:hypothetical protein